MPHPMNPRARFLLFAAALLALVAPTAGTQGIAAQQTPAAPAQTTPEQAQVLPQWQTAAGSKMAFEVASVRQMASGAPFSGNVDLDASDFFVRYMGGLVTTSGPLANYIIFAYKIDGSAQYLSLWNQLPKWAQTEQFYVEARPEDTPTKDQIRLMMQSLLADRFKLALHTETRTLPAYVLVLDTLGKPGPKLQPHLDDGLCTKKPDTSAPTTKSSVPPPYCAPLIWYLSNGQVHMRIMDYTIPQIAGNLVQLSSGELDQLPVLDRTGLVGRYDINLEFLRQKKNPQQPNAEGEPAGPGATFVEALKTQAGLKLLKQTGPVSTLVIDHIEQPTAN